MKTLHSLIPLFFFFSCFISLVFSFSPSRTHLAKQHCLDDQRSPLLQLQNHLYHVYSNFTFSSKFELWDLHTDCCSWDGVTCDAFGHVIGLDLSSRNLSGSFHSIFHLHRLQRLNLAGNNFNNTTLLSYEFGKLSNLTHLNLSRSCFHGQIPMEMSNLTRLVSLDLSHQGYYPTLKLEKPNLKTLIKNLKFLTELYLDEVDISSQSSKWCETTSLSLPNLQVLSLSDCGLEGPLCPSLSTLPFLSKLVLDYNPISHLPPNFLEISSSLVSLSLVYCNLSGHFPTEILLLPKIQSIDISDNGRLEGQLPEFPSNNALRSLTLFDANFSGKLSESIGNLKFLTDLTLSDCNFVGSIPSSIANLSHLVNLDLSANHFSGSIPSSLFTLPSLKVLSLRENQLVGKIDEFPNASSSLIEGLDLGYNYLSGPIPKSILQLPRLEQLFIGDNSFSSMKLEMFSQFNNLRSLQLSNISLLIESENKSLNFPQIEILWLRSCNLTGFLEFIKTQDKLIDLDLSNNHISAFPEFLRSQKNLEFLDLSNNKISGAVPNWVWKKSLLGLNLSNNHLLDQLLPNHNLTSLQGSLPTPVCKMSQLWDFDVSMNNFSGPIPNCLGNLSELQSLDLHGNNFTGLLPEFSKATLTRLWFLKVSGNRLEGKLPRSLAECTRLTILDVGNNMMHDTFPFWLKNLPDLGVLILRGNRFYGQIIHLNHKIGFPTLDVLDIASNQFSGKPSIDFLQATQVRSLKIGENKLEGKLPTSLANCTKLEVLDLGNNMIQDTFPFWLQKLPSLKVLILRGNKFYGTLARLDTKRGFPKLRILDIASNNFSGDVSIEFLQSLKAMMHMTSGDKAKLEYIGGRVSPDTILYYQDSVTIVNKGIEMFYEKVMTILTCLDLSNNSFHGRIPKEIQILTSLRVLNLSDNSFSGQIPSALDNLKVLESLDLSQNKLSGKIPPQLATLTFLSAFNLSYNQLDGGIPQSNQFNTFSNDSYIGNPKLCGLPLSRKCNEVDLPLPPPPGEDEEDSWLDVMSIWQIVLVGYASGLVAGLCIGYTVLNELGNKWVDKFKNHGKRNRRSR
ncbi:hypothetical protein GQ457_13G029770 [Hibiscus cannabinus]